MAIQLLYNAGTVINSIDLSSRVKKAKVNFGEEKKETTAMGNTARTNLYGLSTPSAEIEFYLDPASGNTIQTLRAILGVGTAAFPINIRRTNSAATTSNEAYSMNAIIDGGLDTINGEVGTVETATVKFACASATGWTVTTTSS